MTIEAALSNIVFKFGALNDSLQGLALTIVEDRPSRGEMSAVERLADLVQGLRERAIEAREAATQASEALAHPAGIQRGWLALALANERFIRLERCFFGDAIAHGRISELMRLGSQRGHEWAIWTRCVVQALDDCRTPIFETAEAIFHAWEELGEWFTAWSLGVQTGANR